MKAFKVKSKKFPGKKYSEVYRYAFPLYKLIKHKSRRKPYVRSAYFNKDKIFLELFWKHLWEKSNWRDRTHRLKFFGCAMELIKTSKYEPETKQNPNRLNEVLHRFAGLTKDDELFYVQIKEDKKTDQKWLMSVFPERG
ncbi:MAG: hypothetical protein V1661_01380 [bacterium]